MRPTDRELTKRDLYNFQLLKPLLQIRKRPWNTIPVYTKCIVGLVNGADCTRLLYKNDQPKSPRAVSTLWCIELPRTDRTVWDNCFSKKRCDNIDR